ncbi:winged helix-turn-helix transcriptional regulator [Cobetia sp. cqz5-12]|uniref:MarR family winged helix-turn-helix transcriptional regulator n=1 Tax=Cobetia sp. cqz5-12 TaxID=2609415 RepID=UPI0019064A9E|nr:MarR family winged helix-turn-helix transcriptional regulator [Cobetia sp. cqz5-12]QQK64422.1 winged helix-turn-helix transcriptional regulator [Cobetia sp. cqz5-12]
MQRTDDTPEVHNALDGKTSQDRSRCELDLDQFLPYRLNRLAERTSEAMFARYGERFAINVAEWRLLAWLSRGVPMTAREVSLRTHMDKVRVSRAVKSLESRELILRRPSEQDQRAQLLALTAEGEAMLAELIPEARRFEDELLGAVDARQYRDLLITMQTLERQLDQLPGSD